MHFVRFCNVAQNSWFAFVQKRYFFPKVKHRY
nr:MAG TPA: hypothetical protein [Caudoviricetes sp.]